MGEYKATEFKRIGRGRAEKLSRRNAAARIIRGRIQPGWAATVRFILNLRDWRVAKDAFWLSEPHCFRSIGAFAAVLSDAFVEIALWPTLDFVVFFERSTASRPLAGE